MREIQAELGKSDQEMEEDPELSLSNLMRFDQSVEEGEFDLFQVGVLEPEPCRRPTCPR